MNDRMEDLHSLEWRNGRDSFKAGVARDMNPYNHGSKHRKLWFMGWEDAELKARDPH